METVRGTQTRAEPPPPAVESPPGPPLAMERECPPTRDTKNKKNCLCGRPLDDGHSHDELIGGEYIPPRKTQKNISASQHDLNVALAEYAENASETMLKLSAEIAALKRRVEHLERGLVAAE
jgi:hypothetical protein